VSQQATVQPIHPPHCMELVGEYISELLSPMDGIYSLLRSISDHGSHTGVARIHI